MATAFLSAVEPWLEGQLSFQDARLALIRRSAIHFAESTPMPFHVHHGTADFVVPVEHSRVFTERMEELERPDEGYEYWEYPGGGHGNGMDGSQDRMIEFFCEIIED